LRAGGNKRRKFLANRETPFPRSPLWTQKAKLMSDLSAQIETLYRVIGQIRPEYNQGSRRIAQLEQPRLRQASRQGAFRAQNGAIRPASRAVSVRWFFTFYCFWFSLPLSVWLSSGWIGLFFYWRALSGTARLVDLLDWFSRGPSAALRGAKSSPKSCSQSCPKFCYGGAQCSAMERKAG
jgi:hypothetical protein